MSKIVTITIVAEVPEWADPDDPRLTTWLDGMSVFLKDTGDGYHHRLTGNDVLHTDVEPGFSSAASTLPFSEDIEHLMMED